MKYTRRLLDFFQTLERAEFGCCIVHYDNCSRFTVTDDEIHRYLRWLHIYDIKYGLTRFYNGKFYLTTVTVYHDQVNKR